MGQVEGAVKSHRKEMKRKKEQGETVADEDRKTSSTGEFLSGFWAENRLIPSITVTIFFGLEEWDGPLSLFELTDMPDLDVLACMDNYHVRLIASAQIPDEEIMKFQSSLREAMLFIKYSKDRENLSQILKANEKHFQGSGTQDGRCDWSNHEFGVSLLLGKVSYRCHGVTADSRDLSALVGQITALGTARYYD